MGTWGTGIFEDDVALDVHDAWDEAKERGVADPTSIIRERFTYEGDRSTVFLALAQLQLDAGYLDEEVKEVALASMQGDLAHWKQWAAPEDATERQEVLDDLRQRIDTAPHRGEGDT